MTSPHLRAPGRAVLALLLLASATVAMATATAGPAAAAPCAGGNRSISGTVEGPGRPLRLGQVSIVLLDSAGRQIGLDGCLRTPGVYATTILVNAKPGGCCFILPGTGATSSPFTDHTGTYTLTRNWSVSGIPSNAVQVLIETYTKRSGGQPNTSTERYGHSMRRITSIGTGPIHLVQPLRCGLGGSRTGSLAGRVFDNGAQVTATRVSAFSTSPDDGNGGSILAFNVVGLAPAGPVPGRRPHPRHVLDLPHRRRHDPPGRRPRGVGLCRDDRRRRRPRLGAAEPGHRGGRRLGRRRRRRTGRLHQRPVGAAIRRRHERHGAAGLHLRHDRRHPRGRRLERRRHRRAGGLPARRVVAPEQHQHQRRHPQDDRLRHQLATSPSPATGTATASTSPPSSGAASGSCATNRAPPGAPYARFVYGTTGDLPVGAGTGTATATNRPAIFRRGEWYLRNGSEHHRRTTASRFTYGISGDRPAVGDWDDDAPDEPGILRQRIWYLRGNTSTQGTILSYRFPA